MQKTINVGAEIERINRDIDEMESAGMQQITLSFFSGNSNERTFLLAAMAVVSARGYTYELDYEDGEILLTVRKVA